jgi:hypothetical protein
MGVRAPHTCDRPAGGVCPWGIPGDLCPEEEVPGGEPVGRPEALRGATGLAAPVSPRLDMAPGCPSAAPDGPPRGPWLFGHRTPG